MQDWKKGQSSLKQVKISGNSAYTMVNAPPFSDPAKPGAIAPATRR